MTAEQLKYADEILKRLKGQIYPSPEAISSGVKYIDTPNALVYVDSKIDGLQLVKSTKPLTQGVFKGNEVLVFDPYTSTTTSYNFTDAKGVIVEKMVDVDLIVLKADLNSGWEKVLTDEGRLQILY